MWAFIDKFERFSNRKGSGAPLFAPLLSARPALGGSRSKLAARTIRHRRIQKNAKILKNKNFNGAPVGTSLDCSLLTSAPLKKAIQELLVPFKIYKISFKKTRGKK